MEEKGMQEREREGESTGFHWLNLVPGRVYRIRVFFYLLLDPKLYIERKSMLEFCCWRRKVLYS